MMAAQEQVQARQLRAIAGFSCPFCGRPKGKPCHAITDDLFGTPRDLAEPHVSRLRLLTETDPAIRGSFS
jgi:hypothetical protein